VRWPDHRKKNGITISWPAPYLSESVNLAHASAGMLSSAPSRSVVSRTSTRPASATPASTQLVPLPLL
jgi:hypothetical protein